MATSKENLKKYFETGDKPTQQQYAELIEALRHEDENIPITDVDGLQESLDSKATNQALLNHINDSTVHGGGSNISGADIKTAYEAETNTNAFTDTEKQQVADGVVHRLNLDTHTNPNEKTIWNNKISEWKTETLEEEAGVIYRLYGGNLYQFTGTFTNGEFTTINIETELSESKWKTVIVGVPKPSVKFVSPITVGQQQTYQVSVGGWGFDENTKIHIVSKNAGVDDLIPFNVEPLTANSLSCSVTTNADLAMYEFIVENAAGATTYAYDFTVATESTLIPTAMTWENIVNESDTFYGNGSISPNSLNQHSRTGEYTAFGNGEDFDIIFKVEDIAITNGTVSGGIVVEVQNDLGEFLTRIQKFTGLYYAVSNDWVARFQHNPQSKRWVKTTRINSVISFYSSDDGVTWTLMRTLANPYSGAVTFYYSIPAHGGLSNIQFITKY